MNVFGKLDPQKAKPLYDLRDRIDSYLVNDPESGRYQIDREAFTNPAIFELEMKHIFERNWVFLGHESQIAKPNDFMTTHLGRQPVLLTRDRSGEIHCFINACSHRGARLCRERRGNKKNFSCPFHGWTYASDGALLDVTDQAAGGYPPSFDRSAYGLEEIGRVESYRGFIFGSLSPNVVPLSDYLAGAKTFIDLLVDQSPKGEWEVLNGVTRYTYNGNWKLQAENGLDGYHVNSVHANYLMTIMRRITGASTNETMAMDLKIWDKLEGGSFSFENGHCGFWNDYANFKDRPNYEQLDRFKRDYGEVRAKWMNGRLRNLLIFPNVFLMDQASTQIRHFRPISVDRTEVTTYCMAPVGESAKARAVRIRQYEDFFNASGMATPDDLTEFNNSQIGFGAGNGRMNDLSRGAARWVRGPGRFAEGLDIEAPACVEIVSDEGHLVEVHENWRALMHAAIDAELSEAAQA